ncbi:hypothetical protein BDR04DRAFT_1026261, partial [Suillus decipiens]
PDFSIDEMHHQLVKFIVMDDQASWYLLSIWHKYFQVLKSDLAKLHPFMALTAHWIAKEEWMSVLVLKAALIAFHHVLGSHTGKSLSSIILHLHNHANVANDARNVVRSICASNQRCGNFRDTIMIGNKKQWFQGNNGKPIKLPTVELLLDEPTCWDSVYDFEVILEPPHRAQQSMLSESTPILTGTAVPAFERLLEDWKQLANGAPHCAPLINIGLTWVEKYDDQMACMNAYAVVMCQSLIFS